MPVHEIRYLGAVEAHAALARGDFSAVEYTTGILDHVEDVNPVLHAFLSVSRPSAMRAARAADRRRAAGLALPVLHGLPFAVKDLIDVRGLPTSAQSRVPSIRATRNAAAVSRIETLGGILIGKLGLEEFGIGSPCDDLAWPSPGNPWNTTRTAGGSSSGCAVALAAGLVPLALGTDTAGSVRAPAACCGLVGLKPTADTIDTSGVMQLAPTLDEVGLMARSARDCALLLAALTDGKPLPFAAPTRLGVIDTTRSGCPPDHAMLAALAILASSGCLVGDADFPHFAIAREIGATILAYEANRAHRDRLASFAPLYGPTCRASLQAGAAIESAAYAAALGRRDWLRAQVDVLLEDFDVLALPVTFGAAAALKDADGMHRSRDVTFRLPFNVTGHPAAVFCTGFDADGLPLSMQFVGRHGEDARLLALVDRFQQVTDWHEYHPSGGGGPNPPQRHARIGGIDGRLHAG